mmetsp:Transcript_35592/g.83672  ORF Transcript_35592/g.83672 Transcript_35592/m.83672 type:complete len:282 (+) Transcript_35592:158-1003(+)
MAVTVFGVLLVALERMPAKSGGGEAEVEEARGVQDGAASGPHVSPIPAGARATASAQARGYALAVVNVVFDVVGAVITKSVASNLGPWEIGLVRFGFAALVMAPVSIACHLRARGGCGCTLGSPFEMVVVPESDSTQQAHVEMRAVLDGPAPELEPEGSSAASRRKKGDRLLLEKQSAEPSAINSAPAIRSWHEMPRMGFRAWGSVSLGVLLVTFLAVGLGNVALFRIPLRLFLTLQSLGPVYALPIAFVVKREVATRRAWAGSALAAIGVAAFCHETVRL